MDIAFENTFIMICHDSYYYIIYFPCRMVNYLLEWKVFWESCENPEILKSMWRFVFVIWIL